MISTSKAMLLCLAACLLWALPLAAEQPPRAELITAHKMGTTPPMANYMATHHPAPNAPVRVFPVRKPGSHPGKGNGGTGTGGGTSWTDGVLQTDTSSITSQIHGGGEFEGLSSVGYVPPDTNISVGQDGQGATQIVETVNVDFAVYDTSGNALMGPAPIHTIFSAAAPSSNDVCTSVDGGDPIVLFDKIDQRWIITQLAYCMAISNTADATGSYTVYDVPFQKLLPDYPKFGIWTTGSWDTSSAQAGVYFSANMFNRGSSFIGAMMCGFPLKDIKDRPSSIPWTCTQNGTNVYSILPADLEGMSGTTSPAPTGTAEYFMQFSGSNTLNLYQFSPDFSAGTTTVTTLPSLTVTGFHEACGGGACVPQSNTSTQLDTLGDRLMYRLSYRNYGTSGSPKESMVVTHSVQNDSSSSATGVRWYQLKSTGSGWTVGQQGTFGLNDGNYRWMGSIAQDKLGDLGIGYSVSSPTMYPNLAYTGWAVGDTLGKLEPENLINVGKGAQTSVSRWGDYSSMSVDPSNDCTMWYANEYLKSTGSYDNWGTYISSFTFSGCN